MIRGEGNGLPSKRDKTIKDFGRQWATYRDNEGFYGSLDMFRDMFSPLLDPDELKGTRVAEIGSGSGRIVDMLFQAGVNHVVAVEPAPEAMAVLKENTKSHQAQMTYVCAPGEELPSSGDLDYVFSVGVLHHIPDPAPVVEAARHALKDGGRIAVWLYGQEGNGFYLSLIQPLRFITKRMPHGLLAAITWLIYGPLWLYIILCKKIKLPLHRYMREVIGPMSPAKRRLTVYDQLNPAHAKYYTRNEAYSLIADAGFSEINIHHRHGYSWTVVGTKQAEDE